MTHGWENNPRCSYTQQKVRQATCSQAAAFRDAVWHAKVMLTCWLVADGKGIWVNLGGYAVSIIRAPLITMASCLGSCYALSQGFYALHPLPHLLLAAR